MRVKIGQNDRSTEINIPFLVTIQKINETTLAFSAIKHLLQNKAGIETMVSIRRTTFDNVGKSKINPLLNIYNEMRATALEHQKLK